MVARVILLTLLVTQPAVAQRRASPDSVRAATVRRLLELSNTGDAIITSMEAVIPPQQRTNSDLPAGFWEAFIARARRHLPVMLDSLVPVYATRFSQAELEQLVQFYSSPVGRHLIETQPAIIRKSVAIGQRWGLLIAQEMQDSLERTGEWAELTIQRQMRSDLRNLVVAEEAFFADSVKYTTTVGVGGLDYHPTGDNKILQLRLTKDGWVATMGTANSKTVCAIFVGSTPLAPAVEEGRPACQRDAAQ